MVLPLLLAVPGAGNPVNAQGVDAAGPGFAAVVPVRAADTRSGLGVPAGEVPAGGVLRVPVGGRFGVPSGASAAALNVTVTRPRWSGYVTVFPCGSVPPLASSLNFEAGQTVANGVLARLGAGGRVCVSASAPTQVVIDVNGHFPKGPAGLPGNPFLARPPYLYAYTDALEAAQARAATDPAGAAALRKIASQPIALWLGPWYTAANVAAVVKRTSAEATARGRTAVFVTYALPGRDCGGHSTGGLRDAAAYRAWGAAVADGLRGSNAAVIVEPDALAMLGDCAGQGDRTSMLAEQVRRLSAAGATVYLDAGHSNWKSVPVMAQRLRAAGIASARGFSVNVSNFGSNADEQRYAEQLSAALGGSAYVIDTSRNGLGRGDGWCNPPGRALGVPPRAFLPGSVAGATHLDAYLWIKSPGRSDGSCNGGPAAGTFWPEYAIGLSQRALW